jgi:hypothetical protein
MLNKDCLTAESFSLFFLFIKFLQKRCFLLNDTGRSLTELLMKRFPSYVYRLFSNWYEMYNKEKHMINSVTISLHCDFSDVKEGQSHNKVLPHSLHLYYAFSDE